MIATASGGRGVILGRRETYTPAALMELSRWDLRLVALDLQMEEAIRWRHPFSGRYNRTRSQMVGAILAHGIKPKCAIPWCSRPATLPRVPWCSPAHKYLGLSLEGEPRARR